MHCKLQTRIKEKIKITNIISQLCLMRVPGNSGLSMATASLPPDFDKKRELDSGGNWQALL